MDRVPRSVVACAAACLSNFALAQGFSTQLEVANRSSTTGGSNFILISSPSTAKLSPNIDERSVKHIPRRLAWEGVVTSSPDDLRRVADLNQISLTPILAISSGQGGRMTSLRVMGIQNNEVWLGQLSGGSRSLQKLGRLVDENDERLEGYEQSVANARVLFAYEAAKPGSSDSAGDLTAVLQSQDNVYSVNKIGSTISIMQIGVVGSPE